MAVNGGLWLTFVGVLVVTVLTQFVVGYWVYTRQSDQAGATWFLVMDATGLVFVGGLLCFIVFADPFAQRVAYLVGAFGSMATISAFVVFISKYTGTGLHRNRAVQATLVAIVGGFVVLAPTNASHGLLFEFTPVADPFPHLAVERGIAFHTMVVLIQIPALYSTYLMGKHLLATRQRAGQQLAVFIVGALSIAVLDFLSVWTPLMPLDDFTYAGFGMFFFYGFTALALFRFSLLDVQPVARNTVIENLRDPVLVLDGDGRLVDHNEAATAVWPDIGDGLRDRFESVCPTLAAAVSVPDGGADTDHITLPVDGRERHFSVTVSEVSTGSDDALWYSVLLRDVTELERSRWQLQKQNERLDQVASTISHDLRNPINVALGRVEILEATLDEDDGLPAADAADALGHLDSVDSAHERMEEIIEDVLTIAREGKTVDETTELVLGDVAREAWSHVDTGDATLTVADDRTVRADRSKLLTVFENLFRNSVEHSSTSNRTKSGDAVENGGPDTAVEVGATPDGFYVADDGPGIPDEHRDSVFEYGYSTDDDGTGLGLAIVRTMAESHGWTVELDADYGDGTRVVFGGVAGERGYGVGLGGLASESHKSVAAERPDGRVED